MKLMVLVILCVVSITMLWWAWPRSSVVTTQVAGPAFEITPPQAVASPPPSVRPPTVIPASTVPAANEPESDGTTWLAAQITASWNGVPLEQALTTLAAQVQVVVTFAAHTQPHALVRLQANAHPCGAVLQALCAQTGHDFTINGRNVTIVPASR